jgi:hypothetical protein
LLLTGHLEEHGVEAPLERVPRAAEDVLIGRDGPEGHAEKHTHGDDRHHATRREDRLGDVKADVRPGHLVRVRVSVRELRAV